MIALLFFFLILFASPFKPKTRLENAALRHQLIIWARKVRGHVRLTNGDRLFSVLLSMVSNGSQCYHDYPSRDPRPLAGAAPLGLGVLIALGGILAPRRRPRRNGARPHALGVPAPYAGRHPSGLSSTSAAGRRPPPRRTNRHRERGSGVVI